MAPPLAGTVTLYRDDARTLAPIAEESVHLIVTSPPYPMIPQWDAEFARHGALDYDGMHVYLAAAWASAYRVLVPGGILALNIGDALRTVDGEFRLWPNHATTLATARRLGFRALPYLLWKKPTNRPNAYLGSGFLPPNAYVTLDCEFILLLRKGGPRRFAPKDARREASRYLRGERDRWFSQIWSDVRGASQGRTDDRTGAFPPELPRRLVRMFSVIGDTVLDPFAGTGTTLWEAARAGRHAIGVELDPDRFGRLAQRAAELGYGEGPGGAAAAAAPEPEGSARSRARCMRSSATARAR